MPSEELKSDQPPAIGVEGKEKIKFSIIIADDTDSIRKSLAIFLGKKYTQVEAVNDGIPLLEKLKDPSYTPDFMIIDNIMLEMNGLVAIEKIREMDRFKTTPIVLHTTVPGIVSTEDRDRLGIFVLEKKSNSRDQLVELIETARTNRR